MSEVGYPLAVDPLLELQRIDTAIDRLDHRRAQLESGSELRAARDEMETAESVLGELRLALDEIQRDQLRLEHEVETMTEKLEVEKKRLFGGSIVNPKELEALQREIDAITQRRSRVEDDLLAVMERREDVEGRATIASAARDEARAKADALGGEAVAELDRNIAERASLATERESAAAAVPDELRALYEELRSHKHGIGAAALTDGVCQACHESLSAMELDRIKHEEGIKRCEHCRRILILA